MKLLVALALAALAVGVALALPRPDSRALIECLGSAPPDVCEASR